MCSMLRSHFGCINRCSLCHREFHGIVVERTLSVTEYET